MQVKELREALEDLNDEDEVVIEIRSFTWGCYKKVKDLQKKTLQQKGEFFEDETYLGEPEFPVNVAILK